MQMPYALRAVLSRNGRRIKEDIALLRLIRNVKSPYLGYLSRALIPLMIAGRHESRFSCPECGYRDKSRRTRWIAPQLHRAGI